MHFFLFIFLYLLVISLQVQLCLTYLPLLICNDTDEFAQINDIEAVLWPTFLEIASYD